VLIGYAEPIPKNGDTRPLPRRLETSSPASGRRGSPEKPPTTFEITLSVAT